MLRAHDPATLHIAEASKIQLRKRGETVMLRAHIPATLHILKACKAFEALQMLAAGRMSGVCGADGSGPNCVGGGAALDSFPGLPSGLVFDPVSGAIRGTPTAAKKEREFRLQLSVPDPRGGYMMFQGLLRIGVLENPDDSSFSVVRPLAGESRFTTTRRHVF
ncbi:hypothetical protein T484DRAFT_1891752 [Baffinella frigidus]|nr:hypothetical protein T484DRAFT_1891752 [Cryptophyta sp. CCMP2293]